MEGKEYYQFLLESYIKGDATASEQEELFSALSEIGNDEDWEGMLQQHIRAYDRPAVYDESRWEPMLQRILNSGKRAKVRKMNQWPKLAAAAAIIVVLFTSVVFLLKQNGRSELAQGTKETPQVNDIAPGGDRATLTLADGTVVVLDSAAKGTLAEQGGIKVINLEGQLAYHQEGQATVVLYNTITTPRGGQYQLVLADGSRVWLNAASSIRFPTAFPGNERQVEISGEAYFEVAHDASKPFHVTVNGMDVQVLGTSFNVNSYDDEPVIKTTLLEGRVKVTKGDRHVYLNPGQQAILPDGEDKIRVAYKVDLEEVVAWKNGLIYFDGADIGTVMRQISRWYNLEVGVRGNIQSAHLSGKVSRDLNLSQIVRVLEESGIDIKMEGKKLIATPRP